MSTVLKHQPARQADARVLQQVPVIDISPFTGGDTAAHQRVAKEVADACERIGFLVVTGHGVAPEITDGLYAQARRFFALPMDEKLKIKKPEGTVYKGYSPYGTKTVGRDRDRNLKPSLLESFAIGPLHVTDDPYYTRPEAGTNFVPNLWPARPETLQPAMRAYYHAMERLSDQILSIFAFTFGLPPAYFSSRTARHASILRAIHYPPLEREPGEGEERAGAHTDTTAITILRVDDAPGGLQVQLPSGEWTDVPKCADSFIINIGDIMMRWTNDRFISTMHRVVNPPAEVAATASRLSIAYFSMPNYDAMIECLPGCVGAGAKHPPVTAGKLLEDRYIATYSLPGKDKPTA